MEISILIQSSIYNWVNRIIKSIKLISVPIYFIIMILIKLRGKSSLPESKNYLFKSIKY